MPPFREEELRGPRPLFPCTRPKIRHLPVKKFAEYSSVTENTGKDCVKDMIARCLEIQACII
jgi:hypothetical protein